MPRALPTKPGRRAAASATSRQAARDRTPSDASSSSNVVQLARPRGVTPSALLPPQYGLAVWGKKRSGKSHRVKKLLERCERVIAIDVNGEYWQGSSSSRGAGPLREHYYASELADDPYKVEEPNLSMAVQPDDDTPASAARCFTLVSSLVRAYALPVVVVLEENGDWSRYAQEELITFATRGGHKNVSFVVIAQRPALMLTTVRSQCDELWCFQLDEPADVEAVEDRTKDKAFAGAVRQLRERDMLAWRPGAAPSDTSSSSNSAPSDATPPAPPTTSATAQNPKGNEHG